MVTISESSDSSSGSSSGGGGGGSISSLNNNDDNNDGEDEVETVNSDDSTDENDQSNNGVNTTSLERLERVLLLVRPVIAVQKRPIVESLINIIRMRLGKDVMIFTQVVNPDPVPPITVGSSTDPSGCSIAGSLQIGDQGNQVECLQRFLAVTGDFPYNYGNGYYGSVTAQSVERYEIRNGLRVDGVWNN